MKVWLDDERPAPPGWKHCLWPDEVIKLLKTGRVTEISLDHDLGNDARGTGMDVLNWLENAVADPTHPSVGRTTSLEPPKINIHTANPSRHIPMKQVAERIHRLWDDPRFRVAASRVAARYLEADASGALNAYNDVSSQLGSIRDWAQDLYSQAEILQDLLGIAEGRRLNRATGVVITQMDMRNGVIMGKAQGSHGETYQPHITLKGQRGHYCTCPDWGKRRQMTGPCKHVLALGTQWMDEMIIPGLEGVADRLVGVVEKMPAIEAGLKTAKTRHVVLDMPGTSRPPPQFNKMEPTEVLGYLRWLLLDNLKMEDAAQPLRELGQVISQGMKAVDRWRRFSRPEMSQG